MSVVEERVSAPPKIGEDAREERARILEAAALEIEVRGYAQGAGSAHWLPGGGVCIVGGISAATAGRGGDYCGAATKFGISVADRDLLWKFNDSHTPDEVTFLLRWRAEEIRDGR